MPATPADAVILNELLDRGSRVDPEAAVFALPDSFGGWFDLTGPEFAGRVRALARGLAAAGLHPGDALAVLCSTRFEAVLVDFAAAAVGVVVVPLSPSSSQSELAALLDEEGVRAVVVETARDFARIDELQGDLPLVAEVWQIGLGDLDKLAASGRDTPDDAFDGLVAQVTPDSVAVVLGEHRLTQRDLSSRALALATVLGDALGPGRQLLQHLPATDVHARVLTLAAVATGSRIAQLADPGRLVETMAAFKPTLLMAYPSTLRDIDETVHARAEASGRATALRQALEVAVEYAEALEPGPVPRGLKTRFAVADTLVLRGIRKAAGGRLSTVVAISTEESVTLGMRLQLRALDIRCLEGYGDRATGGLVTLERADAPFTRPVGAVGPPLPGIEVSIFDEGSVSFRGVGVGGGTQEWLVRDDEGSLVDGVLVLEGRDHGGAAPDRGAE